MEADQFTVFTEGDELYRDMLESIRRAQTSIALECYIFEPDSVGLQFIEALIERASSGISVRLHLDAFGSAMLASSTHVPRMLAAGIELKWFNPWRWYKPLLFNRRNHRKLVVIDSRMTWLGGFNIHKENSLAHYGNNRWLDTQLRITGPIAVQAQVYFDNLWQGRRDWSPAFTRESTSTLVSNHNWLQRFLLRRLLALQFYRAQKQIWLCTPYFMPDPFLHRQMVKAAKRGIDVKLLLPFITDRPMTQWVARATYTALMEAGVQIYEFEPRFIHAKMMMIDDDWCSVGSSNLDYRSFFVNYEINLVSSRTDLVKTLQQIFSEDLKLSHTIDRAKWAARGWSGWLYQSLGWLLGRVL